MDADSLQSDDKSVFQELDAEWMNQYLANELSSYLMNVLSLPLPTFGSLLEFKYKNFEKVTAQICDRSQAFTMEAAWAAPLVFSYFPMKDLIHLLSAVMLEKKIVLMSQNLALLTSTLQIFYSLIKPFKYPFPLIFNLPDLLLPLCDAPGAALIGINKGVEYLLEESLPENYPECIFVILNENRINVFADPSVNSGIIEPFFDGFADELFEIYRQFNPETRRMIEYGINSTTQKKPTTTKCSWANLKDKYVYNASQTETTTCLKILKMFYETIFKFIIRHLPPEPIYKNFEKKHMDYEALAQKIIEKNPKDEYFLSSFLQTQIFTYYLEQHYELQD